MFPVRFIRVDLKRQNSWGVILLQIPDMSTDFAKANGYQREKIFVKYNLIYIYPASP